LGTENETEQIDEQTVEEPVVQEAPASEEGAEDAQRRAVPSGRPEMPPKGDPSYIRTGRIPTGRVVFVECPLYPGLEVGFRVDNAWQLVNGGEGRNTDPLWSLKRISSITPVWRGWDFIHPFSGEPLPAPTPQDLWTYVELQMQLPDIVRWLFPDGYNQALARAAEEELGPNGSGGSKERSERSTSRRKG
jgi:hypothetical protein